MKQLPLNELLALPDEPITDLQLVKAYRLSASHRAWAWGYHLPELPEDLFLSLETAKRNAEPNRSAGRSFTIYEHPTIVCTLHSMLLLFLDMGTYGNLGPSRLPETRTFRGIHSTGMICYRWQGEGTPESCDASTVFAQYESESDGRYHSLKWHKQNRPPEWKFHAFKILEHLGSLMENRTLGVDKEEH